MPVNYRFTGVDGSVWNFGAPDCPLKFKDDPKGITGSDFTHNYLQNVGQPGGTWFGINREINLISLDVQLKGGVSGDDAVQVWREWRDALGDGDDLTLGKFEVQDHRDQWRYQLVRLGLPTRDAKLSQIFDTGYFREQPLLQSDVSYWRDDRVSSFEWSSAVPGTRTLVNYGNVPTFVRYELVGPLSAVTLGVGGEEVTITPTGSIPSGEVWEIETDPQGPYIRRKSDKANRWDRVGVKSWHKPLPSTKSSGPPVAQAVKAEPVGTTAVTRIRGYVNSYYTRAV